MEKHELFEELEAMDPNWQRRYDTVRDAAEALGPHGLDLYRNWLSITPARSVSRATWATEYNRQAQAQADAERGMARRGTTSQKRGYVDEGDEV